MYKMIQLKTLCLLLCLAATGIPSTAQATVVRPAPDFAWTGADGKPQRFSQFRGQPVVVLIAPDPRSWTFRRQVGHLQRVYQRLAATGAVCVTAFTTQPGAARSNIPFVPAQDPNAVAALFGAGSGFNIAVIGRDGNVDILTHRVLSGQRVLDIINNSFAVQEALRRN